MVHEYKRAWERSSCLRFYFPVVSGGCACWNVDLGKTRTSFEVYWHLYCPEEIREMRNWTYKFEMEHIACYRSSVSMNLPETKTRSKDKGNEGRLTVLKHETAPISTKHNEERRRKIWGNQKSIWKKTLGSTTNLSLPTCSSMAYSTFQKSHWMPIMHCSRVFPPSSRTWL